MTRSSLPIVRDAFAPSFISTASAPPHASSASPRRPTVAVPGVGDPPTAIGEAGRSLPSGTVPSWARSAWRDPVAFETDCLDLPIEGRLPADLAGTLYRNGPNAQFPDPAQPWFRGDGMIHAFRLSDGRASCRNRWIRTARFECERAAGRTLKGRFGLDHDDGSANTHVISHAGRLLALEERHAPIAIDPRSLTTLGPIDLSGRHHGPFTAHPRIDPATGALLFFGYGLPGLPPTRLAFGALEPTGRLQGICHFDAPFASLVHDFAITEHFVLFPVLPLVPTPRGVDDHGLGFVWSPALGSRLGVLRRGASPVSIRWFEGDACYAFHVMNAFETKGLDGRLRLALDVMRYDEPPRFAHLDGRASDPSGAQARLSRWSLDPAAVNRRFIQMPLDDRSGEFPRIDERQTGLPYRHGWIASSRRMAPRQAGNDGDGAAGSGSYAGGGPGTEGAFDAIGDIGHIGAFDGINDINDINDIDGIVHYDHRLGRQLEFALPAGDRVSEPVFAARPGALDEGDGWLLAVVYRRREDRSDLIVLDARAVDRGPIATIKLPHRVPAGFHGSWIARH